METFQVVLGTERCRHFDILRNLSSIHFILQFDQDEDPCSVFHRVSPIIPLSSADIKILLSVNLRVKPVMA